MTYAERVLSRRLAEGWLEGEAEADLVRPLLAEHAALEEEFAEPRETIELLEAARKDPAGTIVT